MSEKLPIDERHQRKRITLCGDAETKRPGTMTRGWELILETQTENQYLACVVVRTDGWPKASKHAPNCSNRTAVEGADPSFAVVECPRFRRLSWALFA